MQRSSPSCCQLRPPLPSEQQHPAGRRPGCILWGCWLQLQLAMPFPGAGGAAAAWILRCKGIRAFRCCWSASCCSVCSQAPWGQVGTRGEAVAKAARQLRAGNGTYRAVLPWQRRLGCGAEPCSQQGSDAGGRAAARGLSSNAAPAGLSCSPSKTGAAGRAASFAPISLLLPCAGLSSGFGHGAGGQLGSHSQGCRAVLEQHGGLRADGCGLPPSHCTKAAEAKRDPVSHPSWAGGAEGSKSAALCREAVIK